MDDWRKRYIEGKERYSKFFSLLLLIWPYLVVLIVASLIIKSISFEISMSVVAVLVAFYALFYAEHSSVNQAVIEVKLSLLEDEIRCSEKRIKCFETGIDLFYLPLLNLLSGSDGVADVIKLNEINCHRYLAKHSILDQFDKFNKKCVETGQLPKGMSGELLKTIKDEIEDLNGKLMEAYKEFKN